MEKHFLSDMMQGAPEFRAEPWYNADGDCVICQIADEAFVAERIDELLTTYTSVVNGRPIGFQVKGVNAIIRRLGIDGFAVQTQKDPAGLESISMITLLLAAYEEGPRTLGRRKAYAAVMDYPSKHRTIATDELLPA